MLEFTPVKWRGLSDPLAVLARRLPWGLIEATVAAKFERESRAGQSLDGTDLFGAMAVVVGGGISAAGRPKLPIRLMASPTFRKWRDPYDANYPALCASAKRLSWDVQQCE